MVTGLDLTRSKDWWCIKWSSGCCQNFCSMSVVVPAIWCWGPSYKIS